MAVTVGNLGFPRIGARRELKTALEAYWSGALDAEGLLAQGRALRAENWALQRALGVDHVPCNDFSFYDHVLDLSATLGAIPDRFGWNGGPVDFDLYFAMARGAPGCPPLDMTKWFDTNYHYLVPELSADQHFDLVGRKPLTEYLEARALGCDARPVLTGPVSYLLLGRMRGGEDAPLDLLDRLLPAYGALLRALQDAGAEWAQIDEPVLALDLDESARAAFARAYGALAEAAPALKIMLTTYFGGIEDNLDVALALPAAGLHVDLARAPDLLETLLARAPAELVLSLGVIDGRNVWRADLAGLLDRLEPAAARRADLVLAPSCSLMHVPLDVAAEKDLDPALQRRLAFAVQKLEELAALARALNRGRAAAAEAIEAARAARQTPAGAAAALSGPDPRSARRESPREVRRARQRARLALPLLPTTTIGSLPQTADVRKARARYRRGVLAAKAYEDFIRRQTAEAVRWQEEIGLDVLVHGEFERADMVEYFAERLDGFALTRNGWVQSYGSRCVRPPIIAGDVARPAPMTVEWWAYAQSLTARPVKAMLTGPVTILKWSFPRDDVPAADICRRIALALREEVLDLERAGARIIQIDEAALREALPLRRRDRAAWLDWATGCFRVTCSGVSDETQIHTHMCYSEFADIIDAIAALDADVVSIEAARSDMTLLDALPAGADGLGEIGPGVYDIHAARTPEAAEMAARIEAAVARLGPDRVWVNPDCGLKTRRWEEVRPALARMVEAARRVRLRLA